MKHEGPKTWSKGSRVHVFEVNIYDELYYCDEAKICVAQSPDLEFWLPEGFSFLPGAFTFFCFSFLPIVFTFFSFMSFPWHEIWGHPNHLTHCTHLVDLCCKWTWKCKCGEKWRGRPWDYHKWDQFVLWSIFVASFFNIFFVKILKIHQKKKPITCHRYVWKSWSKDVVNRWVIGR